MMFLDAQFLEAKQLPAQAPYPASTLVTLLAGTETISLIGPEEFAAHFEQVKQLTPVFLEVGWRKIDLRSLGGSGKGNAYRLRALRLVDPKELIGA
jgi:hypothetical protein